MTKKIYKVKSNHKACFYYNQENGKCKYTLEEETKKCTRVCKYFEHYSKYGLEYPNDKDEDGQILGRIN